MSEKTVDSRARTEPRGGTIIADRYQVDRLIARGGMAAVYLAHHIKLNRPIALKILSPPPEADDAGAFEERFRLEAETLASLDHPNIVILHDFGETEDGRFFLAMEYVEGSRLSDILRDGPVPVDRALGLIMQVCAALRYAHKRGLVHRDLKPSNLLIRVKDEGNEQVKVVDFGLVKLTEADQSITRAGLILGSPHCMSPEQVKGLDVDHRADIYATGVLLFRCLTGQYPFHGPNSAATMIAHLNQPVPTFFSVAPDLVVPAGLEEVVRKCLEKAPNDRYQNMSELMEDMAVCMNVSPDNFRSVSQSHSTIQRAAPVTGGGSTKWIALAAVAGLLLVGAAGIGGYMLTQAGSGTEATANGGGGGGEEAAAGATGAAEADDEKKAEGEAKEGEDAAKEGEDAAKEGEGEAGTADEVVEPEPAPEPVAAPKPKPRPRPRPRPRPEPEPQPEPQPAPKTEKVDAPPGYEGLPKEFWPENF